LTSSPSSLPSGAHANSNRSKELFAALPPAAWSIRVGQPLRTRARFTVGSAHEFRELLAGFVRRP
jgi:hypothetical protein